MHGPATAATLTSTLITSTNDPTPSIPGPTSDTTATEQVTAGVNVLCFDFQDRSTTTGAQALTSYDVSIEHTTIQVA